MFVEQSPISSAMPSAPSASQNPWSSAIQNSYDQSSRLQTSNAPGVGAAQDMMSSYNAGDASAYPAMTNSYGLGTGASAPIPGAAANPSYLQQPLTTQLPDTSSRGFNPWSLSGESNARGK